jgi:F420-0:gamma-glutamyl ligase
MPAWRGCVKKGKKVKVEAVKTRLVRANEISLNDLLSESIKTLQEKSIVVISSKIVALCEGNVAPGSVLREELIVQESDYYLDPKFSQFGYLFTIVGSTLVSSAGIDQSNSDNNWVLWPRDPFESANRARAFLKKHFKLDKVGVIITDSVSYPLRRGTKGEMIAWGGFQAVKDYVGSKDLFGRVMKVEMSGVGTSLAVAANIVMGEGIESQPLAVVSDIDFVDFVSRNPTKADIDLAFVPFADDIFFPFLKSMPWRRGGGQRQPELTAKNTNQTIAGLK